MNALFFLTLPLSVAGMFNLFQVEKVLAQRLWFPFLFFFLKVIYLFLRERDSMSGEGAEREGDTESEAGSRP